MDYFITGLPRSKTAWMSLYFTRGISVCHHELTAQYGINKCLAFKPSPSIVEGNSDSGLLIYWKAFMEKFPSAPWVNVVRKYSEVRMSSLKFGISERNIQSAIELQKSFREQMEGNPNYLEIPFEFTDLHLEEACGHIGLEYNQYHTDRLRKYNIQMSSYQKSKLMMQMNLDSL